MARRRNDVRLFLNSPFPPLCPPRRVCTPLLHLSHCGALPRCCLLWLALLGPASQAFPSVVLIIIILLNTRSLLLLLPVHTLQHLPSPLDDNSQPGRHGRGCSKRKVRGDDRVEAKQQPLF